MDVTVVGAMTQDYLEFVSKCHMSVMGHNSIPPSRISPQDPEEMQGSNGVLCKVLVEFEIKAE